MSDRLNKYLALHLGISRRQADDLISRGKVRINDLPASLGARVEASDSVSVGGKVVNPATEHLYLLLNKPVGYVSSRRAQGDAPTIYSLLPNQYHALKPVGRLDKDSSGILILTNDGDFAFRMTHPSFQKVKVYQVRLDKELQPLHHQMIVDYGVTLPDGVSKFGLSRQHDGNDRDWIVTMSEGRNRQIRRTFAALGYDVQTLHRTHFGPYSEHDIMNDIAPGSFVLTDMR